MKRWLILIGTTLALLLTFCGKKPARNLPPPVSVPSAPTSTPVPVATPTPAMTPQPTQPTPRATRAVLEIPAQAEAAFAEGKYQRCASLTQLFLDENPDLPNRDALLYRLGVCHFYSGNEGQAREALNAISSLFLATDLELRIIEPYQKQLLDQERDKNRQQSRRIRELEKMVQELTKDRQRLLEEAAKPRPPE